MVIANKASGAKSTISKEMWEQWKKKPMETNPGIMLASQYDIVDANADLGPINIPDELKPQPRSNEADENEDN